MTLAIYAHATDDMQDAAIAALESATEAGYIPREVGGGCAVFDVMAIKVRRVANARIAPFLRAR